MAMAQASVASMASIVTTASRSAWPKGLLVCTLRIGAKRREELSFMFWNARLEGEVCAIWHGMCWPG
jgi:hypothetical protein